MSRFLIVLFPLLRVQDWAKNLFVLGPLIFSGKLTDGSAVCFALTATLALSLLSSAVYLMNDLRDAPRDRAHPIKRLRPIASGVVSPALAKGLCGALMLGGFALSSAVSEGRASVLVLAAAFVLLNVVYTLYLKRKVIADVLALAAGYVLRVLVGGAAIGVRVTHWLLLCTFLLAVFLGFSKRRHELSALGSASRRHRPVLGLYSEGFLDNVSLLTLAMTLTCYVLYTISPETMARYGTDALIYSSVIVMFGLFRYLFLIHVKQMGSPVEILYYDRQIVLAVVVWLVYVIVLIYAWPAIRGLL